MKISTVYLIGIILNIVIIGSAILLLRIKPTRKKSITIPILLIVIGIVLGFTIYYFFSKPLFLQKKTFLLDNTKVSLLVPMNLIETKKEESRISFAMGGAYIANVSVSKDPTGKLVSLFDSCSKLKLPTFSTVYIPFFNKNFEVCKESADTHASELKGYIALMNIPIEYLDSRYAIVVVGKEKYLNTADGIKKVKQIYESLSLK